MIKDHHPLKTPKRRWFFSRWASSASARRGAPAAAAVQGRPMCTRGWPPTRTGSGRTVAPDRRWFTVRRCPSSSPWSSSSVFYFSRRDCDDDDDDDEMRCYTTLCLFIKWFTSFRVGSAAAAGEGALVLFSFWFFLGFFLELEPFELWQKLERR